MLCHRKKKRRSPRLCYRTVGGFVLCPNGLIITSLPTGIIAYAIFHCNILLKKEKVLKFRTSQSKLPTGFEPVTYALRVRRTTYCAITASQVFYHIIYMISSVLTQYAHKALQHQNSCHTSSYSSGFSVGYHKLRIMVST